MSSEWARRDSNPHSDFSPSEGEMLLLVAVTVIRISVFISPHAHSKDYHVDYLIDCTASFCFLVKANAFPVASATKRVGPVSWSQALRLTPSAHHPSWPSGSLGPGYGARSATPSPLGGCPGCRVRLTEPADDPAVQINTPPELLRAGLK